MSKRIGLLTSGGDCAGLNAALRAVTLRAIQGYGWQVFGIHGGTNGFLKQPASYEQLTVKSFDGSVLRAGGTLLGTTNKGDPTAYATPEEAQDRVADVIGQHLKLDGIISIGGDGSLKILPVLMAKINIPFIAIPKTIDNDIYVTERSIGFTTAVNIATEALDRLQPTAASHDRVIVLEVMGRDAGHIALASGIAGGADIILIPEIPYTMASVIHKIQDVLKTRSYGLVVVSEAVKTAEGDLLQITDSHGRSRYGGIAHYLSDIITMETGAETRSTILGHVQRGAQPDASDRLLASAFGVHAVDLLAAGKRDRLVVWQNRGLNDVPITDAIAENGGVHFEDALIKTARGLGIYVGDCPSLLF